jgi:hypothetical protein
MRLVMTAAAAAMLATCASAQDAKCVPGTMWTYTGTAKGTPTISDDGKAVTLAFAPQGKSDADAVVFSSVNPADAGVYQVNGDLDVTHLSDDATITLEGATSAAVGRPFDVTMSAGDGGSSGFSRPINTTGAPFTIHIKMKASNKIAFKVRNYLVCKLR